MSVPNIEQLSGNSALLAGLSKKEQKAVGRLLTPLECRRAPSDREGSGSESDVICSGTASSSARLRVETGPGEFFGELALYWCPRHARSPRHRHGVAALSARVSRVLDPARQLRRDSVDRGEPAAGQSASSIRAIPLRRPRQVTAPS